MGGEPALPRMMHKDSEACQVLVRCGLGKELHAILTVAQPVASIPVSPLVTLVPLGTVPLIMAPVSSTSTVTVKAAAVAPVRLVFFKDSQRSLRTQA